MAKTKSLGARRHYYRNGKKYHCMESQVAGLVASGHIPPDQVPHYFLHLIPASSKIKKPTKPKVEPSAMVVEAVTHPKKRTGAPLQGVKKPSQASMLDSAVPAAPASAQKVSKPAKESKDEPAKDKQPTKPKVAPKHPGFNAMIVEAIAHLKERTGSSLPAIKKVVTSKHGKDLPPHADKLITMTIRRMVEAGKLVKVKGSFKLGEAAKKAAKPKAAKKATTPKVKKTPAKPKAAKKPTTPKVKKATPPKVKKAAVPKVKKVATKKPAGVKKVKAAPKPKGA